MDKTRSPMVADGDLTAPCGTGLNPAYLAFQHST